MLTGKCSNYGLCAKADTRETQTIPDGADFICQECKRPLTQMVTGPTPTPRRGTSPLLVLLIVLALAGGIAYWALGRRGRIAGQEQTPAATEATAVGTIVFRLSGSNTIGARLAPDLVQAWLAEQGASGISQTSNGVDENTISATLHGTSIAVGIKAHGSATAFTDLANGAADLGMASRQIKSSEASNLDAKGLGDMTSNAQERVLGLDGVAVIVNEANSKDSMTRGELADIFSGTGAVGEWHVYARDNKSGTYDTFKERVLGSRALIASATRLEDSRQLAADVSRDTSGIGFVGLPYAVGVKTLAVSDKGTNPLIPNTMTIRTEAYPLSRRLYLYLPQNAKPEARDFVHFALSPQGQDIVEKDGFVGQKVDVMKEKAPVNAPKGYTELLPSADRLSVDLRFRTGSSELDTKGVDDLKRIAQAMSREYNGRGVMLVGFADNTGGAAANLRLSEERAHAVASQIERQGITPVLVTGFGSELPVADNGTPEGREKNRRVEVWLRK